MATGGNLSTVKVSADHGTTWEDVGCTFVIPDVDWGTEAVNKEYCINSKDPIVTIGNNEYAQSTLQYAWTEGDMVEGNKILREAKEAGVEKDKQVMIQVEVNNGTVGAGTIYQSEQIVVGYKHLGFTKDGSIKTEVLMEQTAMPTETPAEVTKKSAPKA